MGRKILAVVVAMIVAVAIIMIVQMLGILIVQPPPASVRNDPEAMKAFMTTLPATAYILLAIGYALGTFAGGFIVTKMSRRESPGMTLPMLIGIFFTLAGVWNFFFALPGHPTWVVVLCLLIYIPFTLLGHKVAK